MKTKRLNAYCELGIKMFNANAKSEINANARIPDYFNVHQALF